MKRDIIAVVLFALALTANVILTLVLMLHFTAPAHTAKPFVCIPMTMQEDEMPPTNTVDYVRCP